MRKGVLGLSAAVVMVFMAIAAVAAVNAVSKPPGKVVVSGTVVSNSGKPIAKAKVFVSTGDGPAVKTVTVFTDKNGRYKTTVSAPNYGVAAMADGYCFNAARSRVGEVQKNEIKLWPEHKIEGKVVDEDDKPLQGVVVAPAGISAYNKVGEGIAVDRDIVPAEKPFPDSGLSAPALSDAPFYIPWASPTRPPGFGSYPGSAGYPSLGSTF